MESANEIVQPLRGVNGGRFVGSVARATPFDFGVRVKPEYRSWERLGNTLIGNGLGMRRRVKFPPLGCRRGAHGVTRPTALGARQGPFVFIAHCGFRANAAGRYFSSRICASSRLAASPSVMVSLRRRSMMCLSSRGS